MTARIDQGERLAAFRAGVDDVVVWPVGDGELRARVDRLLRRATSDSSLGDRRALRGELRQVSIHSLFNLLEMDKKSGYLLLVREGETALLGFRDGKVVRADVRVPLKGREKVFYVLGWADARFEFVSQDVGTGDEINAPTSHLLIEYARQRDEAAAAASKRPR